MATQQETDALKAKEKADTDRVADVRAQVKSFNEKNPSRQIGGLQLMQSVRAKARAGRRVF